MYARIVRGRIAAGQWAQFEAAFQAAIKARGPVQGLIVQWLARDEADADAGYSVSVWADKAALEAYVGSAKHANLTAALGPFLIGDYTATHCDVRYFARGVPQAMAGDLDIYHTN